MGIVASQSSSRSRVWVVNLVTTNPNFNILEVSGIDTDAVPPTVVERIEVLQGLGFSPAGLAVSSDGNLLYVAIDGTNQVAVVSTQTGAATFNVGAGPTFVNVGAGPFGVAINPRGTRVYVGNALSASVSVIDTATNAVITTVPIGTMPFVFGAFATDGPQTSPDPGPGPGPGPAPPSCEDKISALKAKVAGLKYHHRGYLKLRAALSMRAAALVEIDKAKAKAGASDPRVLRAEREFKQGDTALCANHYWRAGHEYWQAYEIAHHVLKYYRYHRR